MPTTLLLLYYITYSERLILQDGFTQELIEIPVHLQTLKGALRISIRRQRGLCSVPPKKKAPCQFLMAPLIDILQNAVLTRKLTL